MIPKVYMLGRPIERHHLILNEGPRPIIYNTTQFPKNNQVLDSVYGQSVSGQVPLHTYKPYYPKIETVMERKITPSDIFKAQNKIVQKIVTAPNLKGYNNRFVNGGQNAPSLGKPDNFVSNQPSTEQQFSEPVIKEEDDSASFVTAEGEEDDSATDEMLKQWQVILASKSNAFPTPANDNRVEAEIKDDGKKLSDTTELNKLFENYQKGVADIESSNDSVRGTTQTLFKRMQLSKDAKLLMDERLSTILNDLVADIVLGRSNEVILDHIQNLATDNRMLVKYRKEMEDIVKAATNTKPTNIQRAGAKAANTIVRAQNQNTEDEDFIPREVPTVSEEEEEELKKKYERLYQMGWLRDYLAAIEREILKKFNQRPIYVDESGNNLEIITDGVVMQERFKYMRRRPVRPMGANRKTKILWVRHTGVHLGDVNPYGEGSSKRLRSERPPRINTTRQPSPKRTKTPSPKASPSEMDLDRPIAAPRRGTRARKATKRTYEGASPNTVRAALNSTPGYISPTTPEDIADLDYKPSSSRKGPKKVSKKRSKK